MNRILVIAPSWVGDLIMAQPLLAQIKKQEPDAILDVMAPAWCFPLLHRMKDVNEAIKSPFQHGKLSLVKRYRLGRSLVDRNFQKAYILPNSYKSALVPYFANIPQRIGWRGEGRYGMVNDLRILDGKKFPKMMDRFLALAYPKGEDVSNIERGFPTLQVDPSDCKKTMKKFGLTGVPTKPIVVMCPGAAGGIGKCWPSHFFAQVADEMIAYGRQVWILGSNNDRPLGDSIEKSCSDKIYNFVGKTSLSECIDLLSLASIVISNDSGLLHVAAALDKPVIGIYGPTDPNHAPPLCDKAKIVSCYQPPMKKDELQTQQVISQIMPERVLEAIVAFN